MSEETFQEEIHFNGIDGATGGYLTPAMPVEQVVELARKATLGEEQLADLSNKQFGQEHEFKVMPEYGDGSEIKKVGWGIIFPAGADPARVDDILKALQPLLDLRQSQAGSRFKIYRGADGVRWLNGKPENKNAWLARHGAGPGPVDPKIVPFYLLIVADPQSIPYEFQYELDVQYAVGRIYFHSLAEYANYAASVTAAESGQVSLPRQARFFGVANPGDKATELSAEHLVKPLHQYVSEKSAEFEFGWESQRIEPQDCDRETLKSLLGGSQTPALLFTASHGMGWSTPDPRQYAEQGALVCADWKGPSGGGVERQHYLTGADLPEDNSPLGMLAFFFACYGAGTPYWDAFSIAKNAARPQIARRPFLSALPGKLLSHPNGGALAVIGHVERAWTYSFMWGKLAEQTNAYKAMFFQLMDGKPIGLALDDMNLRFAEIGVTLNEALQTEKYSPGTINPYELSFLWTANNDARGYAILGDPAVRLPVAPTASAPRQQPAIQLHGTFTGGLPPVFASEALGALSSADQKAVAKETADLESGAVSYAVEGSGKASAGKKKTKKESSSGSPEKALLPPFDRDPDAIINPPDEGEIQVQKPLDQAPPPLQPYAQPFVSPIDGLAFALSAYEGEAAPSFSMGFEGASFSPIDDAKDKIKQVVTNLNDALQRLSVELKNAVQETATVTVTTGVVESLDNLDHPNKRFVTNIHLTGDVDVFIPAEIDEVDETLLALHKEMVAQALANRLEMIKAIGEVISSLFSAK